MQSVPLRRAPSTVLFSARATVLVLDSPEWLWGRGARPLLRLLDDPPAHAYFLLLSAEENGVLWELRSRCQWLPFRPVTEEALTAFLARICARERWEASPEALMAAAAESGGCVRGALNLLEIVALHGRGRVTVEAVELMTRGASARYAMRLVDAVAAADADACIQAAQAAGMAGIDAVALARSCMALLMDIHMALSGAAGPRRHLGTLSAAEVSTCAEEWVGLDVTACIAAISASVESMLVSLQPELVLEAALVRLCRREGVGGLPNGK